MTISELNILLQLDPYAFNRTKRGWQKLPIKHQIIAITAYILRYVKYNKWLRDTPKGIHEETPADLRQNLAHLLALTGETKEAISQFTQCLTDKPTDKIINAKIAFLNSDRNTFDNYKTQDVELDKLDKNWGKSYSEAIE